MARLIAKAPRFKLWVVLLFIAGLIPGQLGAAAPSEYELKAVFIFHFPQFVDWPASSWPKTDSPFVIGIWGENPFGNALKQIIEGEKVDGHPFVLKHLTEATELPQCQIIFISAGSEATFPEAALQNRPVLTVGESEAFARQGGIIRFVTERSRVRLRINLQAARAAGLILSSKLLRVSEVAEGGPR